MRLKKPGIITGEQFYFLRVVVLFRHLSKFGRGFKHFISCKGERKYKYTKFKCTVDARCLSILRLPRFYTNKRYFSDF